MLFQNVLLWTALNIVAQSLQTPPSPAEIIKAIRDSGLAVGNNPVAVALGQIAHSPKVLATAITDAFDNALGPLLPDPEAMSYGGSPPVYPTPRGTGAGGWAASYRKARALVKRMTSAEKNEIVYGASDTVGCSGFTGSAARLGFPGICLNDAESGVRTGSMVSGFPAQIHVGASWNRDLAHSRALYIGREFKAKGVNVALGPVIGPIGRVVKGGRNWEGFSNDPYLSGALVSSTVQGMQESVIACAKHFIGNEQETNRLPFLLGIVPDLLTQSVSSNIDDKTMHELYLWPFYDAVKAGAGAIMSSYQRVNNSYSSQNSKMLNGLLKTELGFQGFVVSDWNGQYTGIASANSGLDLAMPTSRFWSNGQLSTAVKNGSVKASRFDDMVTRILASWYRYAAFQTPGMDNHADVDAQDPAAQKTIFQSAVEGYVLVKNVNKALPLQKPQQLSLFGYDGPGGRNETSADPFLGPLGLSNTPNYTSGVPFTDAQALLFAIDASPPGTSGPDAALAGTLITGGGSGAVTPDHSVSPYDAFAQQAHADGTKLITDFYSQNPQIDAASDACIVFVNEQSAESWDRSGLASEYADNLITNVASQCNNTVVVVHSAGVRLVDSWIENGNITAVIFGHLPGQESGPALVEIMYGRQSPSGRLPYTVAKTESDYGSLLDPTIPDVDDFTYPQSNFDEGVYIDYKRFIQQNIEPRFEFGYGLTYTNFTYSKLKIVKSSGANTGLLPPDRTSGNNAAPEGGFASLYDTIATVTVKVTNTGNVAAAEVAQLYLGIPNSPPKMLRGFDKHLVQAGAVITYNFPLRRRDLSVWDTAKQQWALRKGFYNVMVGRSVLDIQLQGGLHI